MAIFHRYNSEIHGNYRRAYLIGGLLTGLLMAAYIVVRLLMRNPVESPFSMVIDVLLLVMLFLLTAYYRNSLPDKRITLKEAMLFGVGLALVAGVVYGLLLWIIGTLAPQQTVLFTQTMVKNPQQAPASYWAAWWAILSAIEVMLLGAFGAFLAAIFFRNEKAEIKHKTK